MTQLFYLPQCTSTNDELLRFLRPGSTVVAGLYTLNQTHGRGQYGNSWSAPAHESIALTIAVRQSTLQHSDSLFNFHTAVLIRDFLAKLTNRDVKIKWPNDLILEHKKICGILIEKRKHQNHEYYLIGAGINVLQETFGDIPRAGSLKTQTGITYSPKKISEDLFEFLAAGITAPVPEEQILAGYNTHLYRKNQISVFEKNKIRQNGIIKSVDASGYVWIDLENEGLQKFYHKEIAMLY